MARTLTRLMVTVSAFLAAHCFAADDEDAIPCYSRADWDKRVAEIASTDEIRMTLAQKMGDEPYKMTKDGVITFRRRVFCDQLLGT
ncbi:MAG TPA: hypothetical protein VK477_01780, partial [Acidobacteriota bacterium]|nr:hypothetical protein [Acidobacteriota bacterium]